MAEVTLIIDGQETKCDLASMYQLEDKVEAEPVKEAWATEYHELPPSVRQYYTLSEYQWMSDAEKARILQTNTEPEPE